MSEIDNKKDKSGLRLSKADKDSVIQWFSKYIGNRGCSVCGNRRWAASDIFFTRTAFDREGDKHEHGRVFLVINVECQTCGNILTFNAQKIGFGTKHGPGPLDPDDADSRDE